MIHQAFAMLPLRTTPPFPADCIERNSPLSGGASVGGDEANYSATGEEDPGAALDSPRTSPPGSLSAANASA